MSHDQHDSDERVQLLEKAICELIDRSPGITRRKIMEAIRGRNAEKVRALRQLLERREIHRTGSGLGSRLHLYHAGSPDSEVAGAEIVAPSDTDSFLERSLAAKEIKSSPEVPGTSSNEPNHVDTTLSSDGANTEKVFKRYKMPDGSIIEMTKEEFDNAVDVFRILLKQDQKLLKDALDRSELTLKAINPDRIKDHVGKKIIVPVLVKEEIQTRQWNLYYRLEWVLIESYNRREKLISIKAGQNQTVAIEPRDLFVEVENPPSQKTGQKNGSTALNEDTGSNP